MTEICLVYYCRSFIQLVVSLDHHCMACPKKDIAISMSAVHSMPVSGQCSRRLAHRNHLS